ncbi:MAG: ATP-dependent RecD-like DNA helicase [Deltaproteobacteria bacterium]|nr:MAG: ATP-dependent RecD-like DNA helicase [Deltaproteobacteria bacterium]
MQPVADGGDTATTLAGTLERIVYHNDATHWTVAKVAPEAGGGEVTVVGALAGVAPGTALMLHGAWVDDPRYGRQFKVASYATKAPETLVGIERYLGSGLIPGIGPELAKRIVAKFGLRTLDVINADPTRLREVDGIGPARAEKIAAVWVEQRDVQNVMVFLRGHGVSSAYAARIFKKYGGDAVAIIRDNPYRLCLDIWGIGFRTADRIARSLGIAADAPERLEAGLVHVLGEFGADGHLHAPEAELIAAAARILEVDGGALRAPLRRLVDQRLVVAESLGDRGTCYSLAAMWQAERDAAAAFAAVAATPMPPAARDIDRAIADFERAARVKLADQQRTAVAAAARDKCVVITGGPGVGKTTIVRAILAVFGRGRRKVALAAPTGRAAKRLAETTGAGAQTLHRLLAFQPRGGYFDHNADNPLDVDTVIVDEASMVDIELFRALVVALPATAQLILVGDVDQLPSVGPGSVLRDVIASGAATVVRLTEIFRQAAASRIVTTAHRINRGELPDLDRAGTPDDADFFFIERSDPVAARDTIVELAAERIPRRFGLDPVVDIQVLSPMHRGELGTAALNAALQARLNPARDGDPSARRGDRPFRAGDKVMQIRNNYDKEVFNGDIGVIRDIGERGDRVVVELTDGRRATYDRDELDQLVHAYAVSVHKAQGSEYPAVILPLVTQHYMMLQRNLLYTAITRGKRLVVLVGTRRAVAMAVRNDSMRQRWTWLHRRIADAVRG